MRRRIRVSVAASLRRGGGARKPGTRPPSRALQALVARAARATLDACAEAGGQVSLTLLDDPAMIELHRRYLGRDTTTDVIAFPLYSAGEPPLGDIYIGYEQALRQAAAVGVTPDEELARLAIHGTLHVLGYEHPRGRDREQSGMWEVQERIVRRVMEMG